MRIGTNELLIILVVVLLIFGPKNLPKLGKMFGKTINGFKKGMEDEDAEQSEETEKKAVKEVKQGKIDFKVDKSGIVHTSIGKVSFTADQIRDNAKEFIATIIKLKPSSAKGTYIKSIYLSSTMSKGIKIDPKTVEEN